MNNEEKLEVLQKEVPTLCILPFIHFATSPEGRTKPCCIYDGELKKVAEKGGAEKAYNVGTDSIEEIWNSEAFREIRRQMLRGEEPKACRACYREERFDKNYLSYRITSFDHWKKEEGENLLARIEEARVSDGRVSEPPIYFDLRYGNLCNLTCRSCNPHSSNKLISDYRALNEQDEWFRSKSFWDTNFDQEVYSWPANEKFWQELDSCLGKVRKFYFTGGEPTLIAKNYKLMEICIERGYSQQIELMFNTNLVQLPQRFLDCIKQFKRVVLNLSVDGFGRVQEYLRSGSEWPVIERNLRHLAELKLPHIELVLSTVIQAGNLLHLDEIFGFIDQLNKESVHRPFVINPIVLTHPEFLDMQILPDNIREIAHERLIRFAESSSFKTDERRFVYEKFYQIAAKIKQPRSDQAEKLLGEFVHYNRLLDRRRGTDMGQCLPELCELLGINGP